MIYGCPGIGQQPCLGRRHLPTAVGLGGFCCSEAETHNGRAYALRDTGKWEKSGAKVGVGAQK